MILSIEPGIYLEDLFVYPRFRGKGIGKKILKHCKIYVSVVVKDIFVRYV